MSRQRRTLGGIGGLLSALLAVLAPTTALAGTLSIANTTASSATVSIITARLDGTLPAADWSDTGGLLGSSWHGTVAVTLVNDTGTWTTAAGSHSLSVSTSGIYTGSASQGYYLVTVTSDTGTSITAAVGGSETGTISGGAHGAALAVGSKGVTIQFDSGVTYVNGDTFAIHVGNLPASAMTLHSATGSITVLSGNETASFENDGITVTGNTPTTVGSAVAFITASGTLLTSGSFHVVPGMEITYDSNNVWAAPYVATVSYSIVTGP